ncbi:MAG: CmcJ/NvfI family oxidoreductase [Rhodospirillales bacterium]
MGLLSRTEGETSRTGAFNYLAGSVESSLYRNGKVFTRRDASGNDSSWQGADLEPRHLAVLDARDLPASGQATLIANGFERRDSPLAPSTVDFLDHAQVVQRYYPQCSEIVREASGARLVAAFDHNLRSVSGNQGKRRSEGGQQVQPPLHMVHGDYTLTSAPQRLRDLAKPPKSNDTYRSQLAEGQALLDPAEVERALSSGRFAIINLWRNVAAEPVASHPLALCDAASVDPRDLVVFEIHYSDRIGENYYAKPAPGHRWYFYSALTRDEALLIKQWDSAGGLARSKGKKADAASPDAPCTFSFHSAFDDPLKVPGAPDRWSIEVRCIALYD